MDITVIVPTYNRSELLKRTLHGFCSQIASGSEWELIIVSDGSTDSTEAVVMEFQNRLPIRYFRQPKRGVSSARNLALGESRAPVVLFLDDDVIPSAQLVNQHVQFHRERPEKEVGLLGYVTWLPELPITPFMRWYGECGALFNFSKLKNDQEADPRYLYTCNLSFKAEFLQAHGGFSESLSVMEDYELGYRLNNHGMRMYFRRDALGYHNQSFTFSQACARLGRYSDGLAAFCRTDAGRAMLKYRSRLIFRLAEAFVRTVAPLLWPLRPLLDSRVKLPNSIYRLFYWYYGSYRSFWSRTISSPDRSLQPDRPRDLI